MKPDGTPQESPTLNWVDGSILFSSPKHHCTIHGDIGSAIMTIWIQEPPELTQTHCLRCYAQFLLANVSLATPKE